VLVRLILIGAWFSCFLSVAPTSCCLPDGPPVVQRSVRGPPLSPRSHDRHSNHPLPSSPPPNTNHTPTHLRRSSHHADGPVSCPDSAHQAVTTQSGADWLLPLPINTNCQHGDSAAAFPTVMIIQSEAVGPMGDAPCLTQCSNCHQRVTTVVTNRPGVAAWAMCGLLTLMGFICGCCLIPFLVAGFQDAHHSCPLCHAHLHIHTRM
uniref:LITAF domain-containing protein n=1 Tax=Oncorhynchus tshawytscha TaxID=74940 RepID=A0AAZ3RSV6_ONCTS